jgi:hypothetical protein
MPKLPNPADLVSLKDAAIAAGYANPSTLQKAARDGELRTVRLGPRAVMTTHAWVAEYQASIEGKGGRPRGPID